MPSESSSLGSFSESSSDDDSPLSAPGPGSSRSTLPSKKPRVGDQMVTGESEQEDSVKTGKCWFGCFVI